MLLISSMGEKYQVYIEQHKELVDRTKEHYRKKLSEVRALGSLFYDTCGFESSDLPELKKEIVSEGREKLRKLRKTRKNLDILIEKASNPREDSKRWGELESLAAEYVMGVQLGDGTNLKNRTQRQIEIANEITPRIQYYIRGIVAGLYKGKPFDLGENKVFLPANASRENFQDYVQIGLMSIIKTLKNYRPQYALSTFITVNAVSNILRKANEDVGLIKLPQHIIDAFKRIVYVGMKKGDKLSENGHGREDIFEKLILAVPELITLKGEDNASQIAMGILNGFLNGYQDINMRVDEERTPWHERFLTDETKSAPEEKIFITERNEFIREMLETLTRREEEIVKLRFGIDAEEHTLNEVGEHFAVTRERIRQMESKAINKLRHPSRLGTPVKHMLFYDFPVNLDKAPIKRVKREKKETIETSISELDLSPRTENILRTNNITSIENILGITEYEFNKDIHGVGEYTLAEIKFALSKLGLKLEKEPSWMLDMHSEAPTTDTVPKKSITYSACW